MALLGVSPSLPCRVPHPRRAARRVATPPCRVRAALLVVSLVRTAGVSPLWPFWVHAASLNTLVVLVKLHVPTGTHPSRDPRPATGLCVCLCRYHASRCLALSTMGARRRFARMRTVPNAHVETTAQRAYRLSTAAGEEMNRPAADGPAVVVGVAAAAGRQDAAAAVRAALAVARDERRSRRAAKRLHRAGVRMSLASAPAHEMNGVDDTAVGETDVVRAGTSAAGGGIVSAADNAPVAETAAETADVATGMCPAAVGNELLFHVVGGVSIPGGGTSVTRHDPGALDWDFVQVDATATVEGTTATQCATPDGLEGEAGGWAQGDGGFAVLAALERRKRARGGTPAHAVDFGGLPRTTTANGHPTARVESAELQLGVEEADAIPLFQPRPLTAPTRAVAPPTRAVPPPAVTDLTSTLPGVSGATAAPVTGTAASSASGGAAERATELYLHDLWLRNDELRAATEEEVVMHGVADMASQAASQASQDELALVGDTASQANSEATLQTPSTGLSAMDTEVKLWTALDAAINSLNAI